MFSFGKSQINKLLQNVASLKVLVIGDCMLDHYIWGDVHRISPEAPVPVVNIDEDTYRLGGACNVALNLSQLGVKVDLMGPIGLDEAGGTMKTLLQSSSIMIDESNFRSDVSSIVKTRVIVRNQQLCRLDRERFFEHQQVDYIQSFLKNNIEHWNAVIVSDYNKGTITQNLMDCLVDLKKKYNFFLSVDPKPSHGLNYQGVDLLKPNRSEALQMSGLSLLPHQHFPLRQVAERIFAQQPTKYLAITLGNEGIAVMDKNADGQIFPTQTKEVFDVSGAGDTALVALTLAFCLNASLEEAASFANIASGVVVGKVGTASITPKELLDYVQ